MKILSHEYHTSDGYIIKYQDENQDTKEILVEFHYQEIVISEGYELYLHKEPPTVKSYTSITDVVEIVDEDLGESIVIDNEFTKMLEEYITDIKVHE